MRKLIIWSFGNADVYYDWVLLEHYNKWEFQWLSFKQKIDLISQDYKKHQKKIFFPMFEAFFEKNDKNIVYDFVWIYTKQDKDRNWLDTFGIYDVFKKYTDKYSNIVVLPEIRQITLNDAFDEQKIYEILEISLLRLKDQIEQIWYDHIDVNITWWSKIMILLLVCLIKQVFSLDNCTLRYGLWDKKTNKTNFITANEFIKWC